MKSAILLSLVLGFQPMNERQWSAQLAQQIGGETEVRQPNGNRVDILTDDVAWEVEWSDKWPESIGQSLLYGIQTNRKPGVYLLLRGNHDEDYLECLTVIESLRRRGVEIEFRTVDTD